MPAQHAGPAGRPAPAGTGCCERRILRVMRPPTTPARLSAAGLVLLLCAAAVGQTDAAARNAAMHPDAADPAIQHIVAELERHHAEARTPGFAVAIVAGDEIRLLRGFGSRDVESALPVTPDTLFAIGSCTKSMTATVIGMLADDGRLHWDHRPRRVLPTFHLRDPLADAETTIRDLLAHQTGLGGMDLLWYGGGATWDEILACVARAEPRHPFRHRFEYQNIAFSVAGHAAAAAAEMPDWATLAERRLFQPIGMERATCSIDVMRADADHATGYRWPADAESPTALPMRRLDVVAPAGAVNASARAMARWIRFVLAKGEIDGTRLIRESRFEEMWTPHALVTPGAHAGLGWLVTRWEGRRMVTHTGGIDGFGAVVTLLPDDGIGFVLLANTMNSPLLSMQATILEPLVGIDRPGDAADDIARWADFVGPYRFDALGVECTALVRHGRLSFDVPGQMTFQLLPPDAEERRRFRGFEDIAIRFERDPDGAVHAATVFQSGMQFELPRADLVPVPEISRADADPYLGTYVADDAVDGAGRSLSIAWRRGRLAVQVPDQMTSDLSMVESPDRWRVRAIEGMSLRFLRERDAVVGMEVTLPGGDSRRLSRRTDPDPLPSADAIMQMVHAAHAREVFEGLFNLVMDYEIEMVHVGCSGRERVIVAGYDRMARRTELPPFGWSLICYGGWYGWSQSTWEAYRRLGGSVWQQTKLDHPFSIIDWWPDLYESVEVRSRRREDERVLLEVVVSPAGLPARTILIDERTGRLYRMIVPRRSEEGATFTERTTIHAYRMIEGVPVPERATVESDQFGRVEYRMIGVAANLDLDPEPWYLEEPAADRFVLEREGPASVR